MRLVAVCLLHLNPDCMLYAVGKPVYHKWNDYPYGSWLKDPHPRNESYEERIWTAYDTNNRAIFEYSDKTKFRNNTTTQAYSLSKAFTVRIPHACIALKKDEPVLC